MLPLNPLTTITWKADYRDIVTDLDSWFCLARLSREKIAQVEGPETKVRLENGQDCYVNLAAVAWVFPPQRALLIVDQ